LPRTREGTILTSQLPGIGGISDNGWTQHPRRQKEEENMGEYLLIESRDPFESNDVGYYYELARGLVEAGNQVTLFGSKCGVGGAAVSGDSKLRVLVGSRC
jgi:hypothetical protein